MAGEMNLQTLLQSMSPVLQTGRYGFAKVDTVETAQALEPVMMFQELEAVTVIMPWDNAVAAGLEPEFPCCWITLNVHSALDAVGFLARVSTVLADLGMGVNPVAGFYHDHLFLPHDRADDAMAALRQMARDAG